MRPLASIIYLMVISLANTIIFPSCLKNQIILKSTCPVGSFHSERFLSAFLIECYFRLSPFLFRVEKKEFEMYFE